MLISFTVVWVFPRHAIRGLAYFISTAALKSRKDYKNLTDEVQRQSELGGINHIVGKVAEPESRQAQRPLRGREETL